MSFFLPFTSVLLPAALILRCPKKRALQLIGWWKSAPRAVAFFQRATSPPTGLKNFCCLSSRYRRYCRSNHRLFTSSSPPMSEVVFFIVIVRYRCNRRGYCSFDVVIIVVRIYTVNDILIIVVIIVVSPSSWPSLSSSPSVIFVVIVNVRYRRFHCCHYGRCLSTSLLPSFHIIPKASAAQLMFHWRKFVRTLTLHSD